MVLAWPESVRMECVGENEEPVSMDSIAPPPPFPRPIRLGTDQV